MTGSSGAHRARWAMAAAAFAAIACHQAPTAPSPAQIGGRWVVTSLEPVNASAVTPQGGAVLAMDFAADRVMVQSDCNTCSGPYTLAGGSISMAALACTRRACVGTSHEDLFFGLLSSAQTADLASGERLVLSGPRGRILMRR